MRQIGGHLEKLLKPLRHHLVAHQRQYDRQRERDNNTIQADDQRVFDRRPELIGIKVLLEIFKSRPGAPHDTLGRREIFKCDHNPVHGKIRE